MLIMFQWYISCWLAFVFLFRLNGDYWIIKDLTFAHLLFMATCPGMNSPVNQTDRFLMVSSPILLRSLRVYTVISRKVVGKNVHATIPKGNMGYDQHTVPNDSSCRTYCCCFPLAVRGLRYYSFKFLWRTVHSKPPTIPFGIDACTFSDNLSRNSCIPRQSFSSGSVNVVEYNIFLIFCNLIACVETSPSRFCFWGRGDVCTQAII